MRHAVAVIKRKKKNRSTPTKIAPITLVAAKVIPKSITAVRTVPRRPAKRTCRVLHIQALARLTLAEVTRVTARYTTEIPNKTHKKAGVRVIVAVIVRNAVMTPMIMLAAMPRVVHKNL